MRSQQDVLGVGVRNTSGAEVLDSLASLLRATEQDSIRASRGTEGQLIEGQTLATSSKNAGTRGSGEPASAH